MSKPNGLISPQEAQTLNDAYTTRCDLISKDITERPDNRSSWYSITEIEDFIAYAKAQAVTLGYQLDGLRIYCGAYEENKGQAGYSTSFIIPTYLDDGDGKSHDIQGADGLNFGNQGNPPGANYPQ